MDDYRYSCLPFHGDLVPGLREKHLKSFKDNEVQILVASDAFQRGHDDRQITHVINYDAPRSLYFRFNL